MVSASATSVSRVIREEDALTLVWSDGQQSLYPHRWLRANAPENLHPLTGEKMLDWGDCQESCSPWSVYIEYNETLIISWAGLREVNRFPLEDLRGHDGIIESLDLALAAD